MILLDTRTLLWLAADQEKLSVRAKKTIAKNAGALFVSAITAFEIAIKERNKKLELTMPSMNWFVEALDCHGVRDIPIDSNIAISSVQLPLLHNDPCDRIIIATAQLNGMKILTPDHHISRYEQAEVIW